MIFQEMPFISVHQSKLTTKKNTRKGLRLLAERKISYMNLQAENNMYDQVNQSLKEPMKSVKDQNIHH